MSKIGFNLGSDLVEGPEEKAGQHDTDHSKLEKLLMGIFNVPDWQIDLEHSLFWACVFNTQHKVNEC